jgi:hypothetical protein
MAALPIGHWNYRSDGPSIVHMAPTAQDFHFAFGLGDSNTTISTIDADGVAFAAIQALRELAARQDAVIAQQQHEIESLRSRLEQLESLMLDRRNR